jgi:hypothetical protein
MDSARNLFKKYKNKLRKDNVYYTYKRNPDFRGTQIALNSELIQSIHTGLGLRENGETGPLLSFICFTVHGKY